MGSSYARTLVSLSNMHMTPLHTHILYHLLKPLTFLSVIFYGTLTRA
jgi:hypothetical protein